MTLAGLRIAVTRGEAQAGTLLAALRARGAEAIALPLIALAPPEDPAPLAAAIARLDAYDWIVFTSANGVRFFFAAAGGRPVRARFACVGPATAAALAACGFAAEKIPERHVAENLAAAFAPEELRGRRVLLPQAAGARDTLARLLAAAGALVDAVAAYRNTIPSGAGEAVAEVLRAKHLDWVLFTSSSTVENLVALAGREALRGVRIASIGPITSETCRRNGLEVAAEALPHTEEGLVRALEGATES
jgi:uroporphyrinogen III methyltransferase/synthase